LQKIELNVAVLAGRWRRRIWTQICT